MFALSRAPKSLSAGEISETPTLDIDSNDWVCERWGEPVIAIVVILNVFVTLQMMGVWLRFGRKMVGDNR